MLKVKRYIGMLGGNKLLYFIIGLFMLQALWVALSLKYPLDFDEAFHVPVIEIFSKQLSPIITNQPMEYDKYGNLTHGASVFYHYLMSFPYRFAGLFTDSFIHKVIFLRTLNIMMVAAGIYLYAKLFRLIGIRKSYINVGLFIFILLPIVPYLAAHVNYDNLLFLLTSLFLLTATKTLMSKKLAWQDFAWLIIIGCFASLVKFTFLPIFATGVTFIGAIMWRLHGKEFTKVFSKSIKNASTVSIVILSCFLIVLAGLFTFIYGQNIVQYGSPSPQCQVTLSKERCSNNFLVKRHNKALETRDQRPLDFAEFTVSWYKNMTIKLGISHQKLPPPIMKVILLDGAVIALAGLLYAWRSLSKNIGWYFLVTVAIAVIVSVFLVNLSGYINLHTTFANQARYLLSILPVLIVMSVVAYGFILRRLSLLKPVVLFGVLLLFTQGGGIITQIVLSEPDWYWQNSKVTHTNQTIKRFIEPLVLEDF